MTLHVGPLRSEPEGVGAFVNLHVDEARSFEPGREGRRVDRQQHIANVDQSQPSAGDRVGACECRTRP